MAISSGTTGAATGANAGTSTAATTTAVATAASFAYITIIPFTKDTMATTTAVATVGSSTTCGYYPAFTHQIEGTALRQLDAGTSTILAVRITARGCERDTRRDVDIYRSPRGYGQSAASCNIGKSDVLIDIVTSRRKRTA